MTKIHLSLLSKNNFDIQTILYFGKKEEMKKTIT